ncbi:MAG: hypothetical protein Q9227_006337 [Pyrenula ochraceoflavens]
MLDVNDFIKDRGGDPDKIKESQRKRYAPEGLVDEVIALYEEARKTRYEATQVGSKINELKREIGTLKKAKKDADEQLAQKTALEKEKNTIEELAQQKELLRDKTIKRIGNYVHDTVPVSNDEVSIAHVSLQNRELMSSLQENNKLIRTWTPEGVTLEKKDCLSHHEVLTRLDGYDPERAVKIAGHRAYCLINYGLLLNQALIQYGLAFLFKKGYKLNQPPYFMLREQMAKTAQLEQFDEELYKVTEGDDTTKDKYLIATSEQPISALHCDEWLTDKDLPIKYAGYSTNFRKEAGSHGKDAWGVFRVHQFEKIEQFVFIKPEDSWQAFEDMIATSEEFYQSLELPYEIVAIVSGALNNAASKKYDLNAFFPFQNEMKELVSCSNCTSYQTRELEIRYGAKKETAIKKSYVHALNSTLCACERTLCCILENYQTEDGFKVPEVLRKYIPGEPDFLPFVKELPKNTTSEKVKGKNAGGVKQKVEAAATEAAEKVKDLKI